MKKIIFLFVLFILPLSAQKKDPEEIIKNVQEKFSRINDYVVDVNIKVDVNFLKVPESSAKIYFKHPDKIHIEADGFALLPKEGLNFSPSAYLKGDYTSLFEKEEMLNGHNTDVVKIIPLGNSSDIILSTFWIDQKQNIIRKVETSTKTSGTYMIEFAYNDNVEYALPKTMIFTFNVDKMNIPRGMTGEMEAPEKSKKKKDAVGKVYINYSNFIVNKGIDDSVFK